MHEIVENVFLGDIKDVENGFHVCQAVVSVYNGNVKLDSYKRSIAVSIEDSPSSNLLNQLPRLVDFIKSERSNRVLVHCFAGSSRSVSVLLAFLLSESCVSSVEEGLDLIVERGGSPNPNEGFLEQLQLWLEMGCSINTNNIKYKEFKMAQLQESALLDELKDSQSAEGQRLKDIMSQAPSERDATCWKCKKCRRSLFYDSSVIPHDASAKVKQFRNDRHSKPQMKCHTVFTEAITWMEEIKQGNVRGLLQCPKCKAKVGHFDWAGIQCSCGKWVSPAIQIQRKQVDEPIRC